MTITAAALANTNEFSMDNSILRAYDIRGVYEDTLTDAVAYAIGRAFATSVARITDKSAPVIATARDGRLSSPALSAALIHGMKDAGAHVLDAGLGPTPLCYFAVYHLQADAGVMVTGSHNPPTHNGFKMSLGKSAGSRPFYGDDIQKIGQLITTKNYAKGEGRVEQCDIIDAYIDRMLQDIRPNGKPLNIVWDAGNGAAGEVMQRLCAKLPGEHTLLFADIDGNFPNHHPDPTIPANLKDLIQTVADKNADFGVAFDGDGDRIGAVDAQGRILWGDQLLMFFARDILARNPGGTIIADVKASQALFDDVAEHGGRPLMWKTGHSLIKAKMKEENALVAGEMSGHMFFADGYYGFDDGLYAAVRLLDLAAQSEQSLTQMRSGLKEMTNTPEIRIDVEESRKFAIVDAIKARLRAAHADMSEVDGVRVAAEGGWWLARASNTQAAIIVRAEAPDSAALERLKQMVEKQLQASGITTTLEQAMQQGGGH